jgi:hypothetical protein
MRTALIAKAMTTMTTAAIPNHGTSGSPVLPA